MPHPRPEFSSYHRLLIYCLGLALPVSSSQMVGLGRSRKQANLNKTHVIRGRRSGGRRKSSLFSRSLYITTDLGAWNRQACEYVEERQLYSQAKKTGKKTILKSWSNRPFPAKQSHGTKTPCWNANSVVRPWNESSTSNAFVFPTSPRKLIRPFPHRFKVLSLSTFPYTFVIICRLVTKLRVFIVMYYLSSDFEH